MYIYIYVYIYIYIYKYECTFAACMLVYLCVFWKHTYVQSMYPYPYVITSTAALHLPTRGPRVGARGCFSISWVGSRLPMQKREKRVRGSGARVGSSHRNIDPRQQAIRVGGAAAGAACQGHLLSDLLCRLFLPRHTQAIYSPFPGAVAAAGSSTLFDLLYSLCSCQL